MQIETGQMLLHYQLGPKLGEGGMGAVWRATDTTLGRDVAIKLLPQLFANDDERLARFEREAKLLASLNHPNIAAIYGLHELPTEDGLVRFLAMELVDGEDLSKMLRGGPLSVDSALEICAQIAAGMEAAHESGVIHRDLKPANVVVSNSGQVKILDFGLAKGFERTESGSNPSLSPTVTSAGTVAGMILGTAAYMAPEQARGKEVDRRADIWSFGCIVWETLTGKTLFGGETISDSLAAILRKEIDWSLLPAETPPMVQLMLRRCLSRDLDKRLRDAGDARIEIDAARLDPSLESLGLTTPRPDDDDERPNRFNWLPWALCALAFLIIVWGAIQPSDSERNPHRTPTRLVIEIEQGTVFGDESGVPAISPDGSMVAFGMKTADQNRLWVRHLDEFKLRELEGSEGGVFPFWSPDGNQLGFAADGQLKIVDINNGRTRSIKGAASSQPRGTSWGPNDLLLFAPNSNSGIKLVNLQTDEVRDVTTLDPNVADLSHRWPHFLPDGKHFIFISWTNDLATIDEVGGIFLGSIDGGEPRRLLPIASSAMLGPNGRLLFVQGTELKSVSFDLDQLTIGDDIVTVQDDVLFNRNNGHAAFTVAANGTLIYAPTAVMTPDARLLWSDREGNFTPAAGEPGPFLPALRLSPDERRAVALLGGATDDGEVWIVELDRGVRTRLTPPSPWSLLDPLWSPDGSEVLYASQIYGSSDFFVRAADGSGEQRDFFVEGGDKSALDWSRDGRYLLYWPLTSGVGTEDIWLYDVESRESRELISGRPDYENARFSPNADYIVYSSNESGRREIFIQQIATGARRQVSTAGGALPHWSGDGSKILFLDPDGRFFTVDVSISSEGATLGPPRELFSVRDRILAFDATADLSKILIVTADNVRTSPLHVVLDAPLESPEP